MATIPITNNPSPITITAGITIGRFTTRTADQQDHPEREGREPVLPFGCSSNRSLRGSKNGDTPEAT